MKKLILLSVMALAFPTTILAQDDVYFTPSKESIREYKDSKKAHRNGYYSGIDKSDNDYNRRGLLDKVYKKLGQDSLGNDIVQIKNQDGTYQVDTIYQFDRYFENAEEDFAYSRRMGRFDDFYGFYYPWGYGNSNFLFYPSYGYVAPWYLRYYSWTSGYFDPWWYYGYYSSWNDPWRYPFYGYYGYSIPVYTYRYPGGHSGTANHWNGRGGSFGSYNPAYNGQMHSANAQRSFGNMNARSGQFGNSNNRVVIERNNSSYDRGNRFGTISRDRNADNTIRRNSVERNSSFNIERSNSLPASGPSHAVGGGSFGGSRSGGGSFGNSRSGGGSFGGHR